MGSVARKVLVMDHSPLSLEATAQQLRGVGFEVRTATTRAEFDHLLARWWPEVAILEVDLADADGAELCAMLKARIAVRVILFSSLATDDLAARARSCGADGYLSKRTDGYRALPRCVVDLCGAATPEPEPPAEARRVLMFDDSPIALEFIASLLQVSGFEVRSALTLDAFERELTGWKPELILTDVDMPEIKGGELCRRLKADIVTARTPVILMSGLPRDQLASVARRAGADAALSKLDGYDQLGPRLHALCDEILW